MSAAETVSRQWDILNLIPRLPRTISARDIHERLPSAEYDVSLRTIQRDLMPQVPTNLQGWEVHGWYGPAESTAGDFYEMSEGAQIIFT